MSFSSLSISLGISFFLIRKIICLIKIFNLNSLAVKMCQLKRRKATDLVLRAACMKFDLKTAIRFAYEHFENQMKFFNWICIDAMLKCESENSSW